MKAAAKPLVVAKRAPKGARSRSEAKPAGHEGYPASESIGLLMRIALFGLRSSFKSVLTRHKVSWSAWYYLRVLWEVDGITQRELTERVGTMQPNTVSALRNMKRAGLVDIARLPDDRRSTQIRLTAKARKLMARILPEMRDVVRSTALAGFSARDEAELRRLLNRICLNQKP